jgi:hypothetical protein
MKTKILERGGATYYSIEYIRIFYILYLFFLKVDEGLVGRGSNVIDSSSLDSYIERNLGPESDNLFSDYFMIEILL